MTNFKVMHIPAWILLVSLISACDKGEATGQAPPPPSVEFQSVELQNIRDWHEFNGRVMPIETVTIQPRVTGYIDKIAFTEGSEVRKGDLLFQIDPRPYKDALLSAEAQLSRAVAARDLAKLRAGRAQSLVKNSVVSNDTSDSAKAELAQKIADVNDATAQLSIAKLNLEFTEVKAPIDGKVGRAELTVGNLAQADQTQLTSIVSQDAVYVYFDVDENSYLLYQENGAAKSAQSTKDIKIGLSNESGLPHTGTLDFIDNRLQSETGTIRVRATLSNHDRIFTPGLYARAAIDTQGEFQTILLSDKAIITDQDRKYVYVVDAENKAQRKDVTIGRILDGLRVVKSGLSPGDKVVVTGAQKIFYPGMEVTPKESNSQEAVAVQQSSK